MTQIATFAFHDVTDVGSDSGFQRPGALPYRLTRRRFLEHLDRIAAGPCRPATVTDLDLSRPGRHLLLTADDGGKSALYIGEELARRGWPGHFFVVTSLIGTRTFLSASEVRTLRAAGHTIGTHSHTHPDIFRDLSVERMTTEWRTSREILAGLLGEPCETGSVPGGDISDEVLRVAAAEGLRFLFVSEPWLTPHRVGGCWILGRFTPRRPTPPERIGELARFQGWASALAVRRLKGAARRSLPMLYRTYVRWTTQERS
jgi:peptidoglycan/xylan/chitin deacetylase (PgdA/CDA1 family)